ncbi:uncharacterized protein LOC115400062 [Salarias fasciatus]|uniref:uncharacterized protein LOC115400062 n=1 Tax=Salarias fasciatus TaxID=181472 RepID=UPI001176E510|nr:uncharacterized protein LOC115400062 [Salarias fasciatus]
MKFLLLLLFVSLVCLSSGFNEVEYGKRYGFDMTERAHTLEFTPKDSWTPSVLWRRRDTQVADGQRWRVSGTYFEIPSVTHRDSGTYRVLDDRRRRRLEETLHVYHHTIELDLKSGQRIYFSGNVAKHSCNIFFFPKAGYEMQLVHEGVLQDDIDNTPCSGFYFEKPCQLSNENPDSSCSGHYEVRDEHGDVTLDVYVEMQSQYPIYFVIGGFILVVILVSCCATRLCCGRSSSRTKPPAVSEAVVRHNEYEQEPVGPRQNQLSQAPRTRLAAEPSRTTTGPLIHDAPRVNLPPAYSSMYPHVHQPDGAAEPLCSEPEPRFEPKGLNFNFTAPLGSDSTQSDVYTSDKLNFL